MWLLNHVEDFPNEKETKRESVSVVGKAIALFKRHPSRKALFLALPRGERNACESLSLPLPVRWSLLSYRNIDYIFSKSWEKRSCCQSGGHYSATHQLGLDRLYFSFLLFSFSLCLFDNGNRLNCVDSSSSFLYKYFLGWSGRLCVLVRPVHASKSVSHLSWMELGVLAVRVCCWWSNPFALGNRSTRKNNTTKESIAPYIHANALDVYPRQVTGHF